MSGLRMSGLRMSGLRMASLPTEITERVALRVFGPALFQSAPPARASAPCLDQFDRSDTGLGSMATESLVDTLVEGGGWHRLRTGQGRPPPKAKLRLRLHEPPRPTAPRPRLNAELAAQCSRHRIAEPQPAQALRPLVRVRPECGR